MNVAELPWPGCDDETKGYILTQALVTPPCPIAVYLMAKNTLLAIYDDAMRYRAGEPWEQDLWDRFHQFSEGLWTFGMMRKFFDSLGVETNVEWE